MGFRNKFIFAIKHFLLVYLLVKEKKDLVIVSSSVELGSLQDLHNKELHFRIKNERLWNGTRVSIENLIYYPRYLYS